MAARQNNIQTLYDRLFKEMEDLQAGEVEVEHANAVANLSNAITRAAEVELKFVSKLNLDGTGFIPDSFDLPAPNSQPAIGRPQGPKEPQAPSLPRLVKAG